MLPEMKKFDEEVEAEVVDNSKALAESKGQSVALKDYTLDKITTNIDQTKSYQEQIDEYAEARASVDALEDDGTQEVLMQAKKSQYIDKAAAKVKQAKVEVIEAETDIQKAKREKYQLLFDTFGVSDHVPDWLLKVLMVIFVPPYVLFVFFIGIPTGLIRYTTDCIEGVLCKYDEADPKHKPHIKVTIWILLVLIIVGAICLTTLGCLHII